MLINKANYTKICIFRQSFEWKKLIKLNKLNNTYADLLSVIQLIKWFFWILTVYFPCAILWEKSMIPDETNDVTTSWQSNQAMKKALSVRQYQQSLLDVRPRKERTSVFNIYISDYSRRVRKNQEGAHFRDQNHYISGTDNQHSSRRADAAGALLLVVLLQGFLGLPCLHLLLSADD